MGSSATCAYCGDTHDIIVKRYGKKDKPAKYCGRICGQHFRRAAYKAEHGVEYMTEWSQDQRAHTGQG